MVRMFVKIFLLLLLSGPLLLHAQQRQGRAFIDSLLIELPEQKEDSGKVNILNNLASACTEVDAVEGMKYGKLALDLAEHLGFKKGLAAAYNIVGSIYCFTGTMTEALDYESAAMSLATALNDKYRMGKCYYTIGLIHYLQGNNPEALRNFIAGFRIIEETGDKEMKATLYLNIGNNYTVMGLFPDAMKYYNLAFKTAQEINQQKLMAASLNSIATLYNNSDNYSEALKNSLAAIKITEEIGDKYGKARCYNIVGLIYFNRQNYSEALKYFTPCVAMLKELHANWPLGYALEGMGESLFGLKRYAEAEKYFNEALLLGQKSRSLPIIKAAWQFLSPIYTKTHQDKKALYAFKAFMTTQDSIYNIESTRKTVEMQMQHDFDKKESAEKIQQAKKDAFLTLQIRKKNALIYGTMAAFTAFLVISTLLIRQSKLKANQQRVVLEQKQLRAQMNPHFIFNCLNSIQHFVVANDVKNANKYLSGFASLMRQTLENSKEGTVTLRKELVYLENYLSLELMRFEDKFTCKITCAQNINVDTLEIPSMIIQPFIENAIRHGLTYLKDRPGKLEINFYLKEGYLFCEIDDNGIGREHSQKLKAASEIVYESHGMELTRQRLALVSKSNGSGYQIDVRDKMDKQGESAGTTIIIKFPTHDDSNLLG